MSIIDSAKLQVTPRYSEESGVNDLRPDPSEYLGATGFASYFSFESPLAKMLAT
jgi:hypothetical protein